MCTGQSLTGATGTSAGTCSWNPVNCVSGWGDWGGCSVGGTQSRTYTVTKMQHMEGQHVPVLMGL